MGWRMSPALLHLLQNLGSAALGPRGFSSCVASLFLREPELSPEWIPMHAASKCRPSKTAPSEVSITPGVQPLSP